MNLFKHQQDAVDFLIKNNGTGAVYHEIGCGKTRTVLEAFGRLRCRMLVVCPIALIEAAWGEDIKKFTTFTYANYRKDKRWGDKQIIITNFESLSTNKGHDLISFIRSSPDTWMIAVDESSKMKNHKAAITKRLLSIAPMFQHRVIMSGTPAPNSEMEYWAQMRFLHNRIFHPNFYAFRNHHFHLQRGQQTMPGQVMSKVAMYELFKKGWKYKMSASSRQEMTDRMAPWCHFAKKAECLDLPDQTDEFRVVEMGKVQRQIYNEMKYNAVTQVREECGDLDFENPVVARIALVKLMKLRQITSGFAITESGEVNEIKENPKLKELFDVLDENANQQAIIWVQFKHEFEMLMYKLERMGGCCVLRGGMTDRERDLNIKEFQNGRIRYLLAHPAAAGHGLTFVNCSMQVFFSYNHSFELYEQARGRTHRAGQKNPCVYIHMVCNNSIDGDILDVLRKKKTKAQLVERYLRDG